MQFFKQQKKQIDEQFARTLSRTNIKKLKIHSNKLPSYRFVDLYNAVEILQRTEKI